MALSKIRQIEKNYKKLQKWPFWEQISPICRKKPQLRPKKHSKINISPLFWRWHHCKSLYIKGFVAP
jgi:hypothetical protein